MICSNYHIELNPGDAGIYDRYVVQDVIKEMAANRSLASGGFLGSTNNNTNKNTNNNTNNDQPINYKIVVLVEVDKLSRQAQAALRRTMEKYSCSALTTSQSKVIEPVGLMYVETNCCGWKQSKAKEITKEESPARLIVTREKLYELLVNCIPASVLDTAVFALFFPFAGYR